MRGARVRSGVEPVGLLKCLCKAGTEFRQSVKFSNFDKSSAKRGTDSGDKFAGRQRL